ncbi:hypothetical protein Tco_0099364 [Tanacetum coccineum]
MQEAVDVAVQLKYDRIREESTTANQQFLDSIDDGMKKIIKEQVKKEVSKIIPKVEKLVTDQLESEVLVRSSKEANTSHAVAANLSELELKKILIDKMEANNSINRSDIQRQLYKALVEAYEADQILLDTYGDTVTIKRPRDGADDDEEPSAGTDRGSKRSRSGKEPAYTSAPSENETRQQEKTTMSLSHLAHQEFETGVHDEQAEEEVQHLPDWFQQPTRLPSPDHAWNKSVPAVHESVQPWLSNLANHPSRVIDELKKRTLHLDFSAFVMNRKPTKPQRIIGLDHPEGIDDVLYKFKKATSMTRIQDIEDMLLLLVQGKVTNLNVEERIAFNVSLRMFTRSVVIQRRVEDLQLGVESYQKKLNLTKPDTYRSNLRRQDAYTPYSDPRGFIYENKDKKNRLMRIDELHKFSDGTLDDVRTALNDRLKGIRMEYLPQTFWSQRDKANARAMIQAIEKRLKTRRIMRSLERFVGGRPYGEHAEYDESNTYVLERFNTTAGNPVKKILLKLNLSDHRLFKDSGGVARVRIRSDFVNTYPSDFIRLLEILRRYQNIWKMMSETENAQSEKRISDDIDRFRIAGGVVFVALDFISEVFVGGYSVTVLDEKVTRPSEERKYLCETSGRDWQHITSQLNNLGREIKKVNEKVYAAQVGCEQCKGPHYTKDFPLKEEGKTLEEAYYTQFGGPFQGGGYRAATPGFYQRNNANPSYQE